MKKGGRATFEEIVNDSVNQTLARTILTGVTVFVVLLSLFFLGGSVIHDFAFALLVGVLVGTFSSVFVASAIVIYWRKKRGLTV
jgi:preprotein translocase subunit SecF